MQQEAMTVKRRTYQKPHEPKLCPICWNVMLPVPGKPDQWQCPRHGTPERERGL